MNLWDYLKETPNQRYARHAREERNRKARVPSRMHPPTGHPDDAGSFEGMDKWWGKRKGHRVIK